MIEVLVLNTKGGCGKSTLVTCLADILEADIIDLDPQKTITNSSVFTKRHVPVEKSTGKKYLVYDTSPYRDMSTMSLLKSADYILMPSLLGYPDLLATKTTYDMVKSAKKNNNAWIIFNKIRKNSDYDPLKNFFFKNFEGANFAQTELPAIKAFQGVLVRPLKGRGRKIIENLLLEIGIK